MTEQATAPRPAAPPLTGRGGSTQKYIEIPEGTWRFEVGKPELRQMWSDKYSKWSTLVDLPITLIDSEKTRLAVDVGDPPDGYQQSWKPAYGKYGAGYTLNPTSAGKESALVTFMAACFGAKNAADFRKFISAGGCPVVDAETNEGRIEQINSWLGWIEGAELYMTIRHEPKPDGTVLARAGGPLAIGSLPGQPEPAYSATWKAKLRALVVGESRVDEPAEDVAAADLPTEAERMKAAEDVSIAARDASDARITAATAEPAYTAQGEPITAHDFMTCKCEDCSEKLRVKMLEMFGSAAGATA